MTNGGVMIGRIESARRSFFSGNAVRVATSAKARPSAVEPAPQASARTSVFQPTPQRWPPVKQPKPQTFGVKRRAPNAASDQAPASFWNALDKIRNTG